MAWPQAKLNQEPQTARTIRTLLLLCTQTNPARFGRYLDLMKRPFAPLLATFIGFRGPSYPTTISVKVCCIANVYTN